MKDIAEEPKVLKENKEKASNEEEENIARKLLQKYGRDAKTSVYYSNKDKK